MGENEGNSVKSVWKSVEKCEKVQEISSKIGSLKCGFLFFHCGNRLTEFWFWRHSYNGIFASHSSPLFPTLYTQFSQLDPLTLYTHAHT